MNYPILSYRWMYLFLVLINIGNWGCAPTKNKTHTDQYLLGAVIACSNINLYQLSEDNKSYIQVIINTKQLDLIRSNEWEVSPENDAIVVKYLKYNVEVTSQLCNDIRTRKVKPLSEHIATSGTMKLEISDAEWKKFKNNQRYKIDIKAVGLKLIDETFGLNISQATVGWKPG